MNTEKKQLTLAEKWELDIKAYKQGPKVKTSSPQCEKCKYFIKGNALHCEVYKDERKPKYVMFCRKECPSFCSDDILKIDVVDKELRGVYGGVFGFCIGDMMGVPVEFSTRQERELDEVKELRAYGTYNQPFGTWSDDTSLMLCLIDAFTDGFTIDKLKNNMIRFYKNACFTAGGEVFDIGVATQKAIEKMILGIAPLECGGKSELDNGNGSLMRVLPIAFWGKKLSDSEVIRCVENVSALTHAHKRSKLACIFYVKFAMELLEGKEKMEAYDNTIAFIRSTCEKEYVSEFDEFNRILDKEIVNLESEEIRSTGYVVDTLEAVLWIFFKGASYKEVILKAINLGGDTDTIAAIVGGIAGIYYGVDALPDSWIQSICRKNEIKEMVELFGNKIKSE